MTPDQVDETADEASTNPALTRLERIATRAKATLYWERIWPYLVAILGTGALFLTLSWLGLWLGLPRPLRIGGVALFGLALLAILVGMARVRFPTRADALGRLDRDSGLPHRPASGLSDRLANAGDDPATRALWQLHRKRLVEAARRMRLAPPSPRMVDHDRYALRSAVLIAAAASAFVAGPERFGRVAAAFDWRADAAAGIPAGFRVDAWIDPPVYTGKPPIVLKADSAPGADPTRPQIVQAPVGSGVVVKTAGAADLAVEVEGGLAKPDPPKPAPGTAAPAPTPAAAPPGELRWILKGDAKLILRRGDRILAAYDIGAIADQAPVVTLSEPPVANARGSLTLKYRIADDYGVVSAAAAFARPIVRGKPVVGRSLVEPPKLDLMLPPNPGGLGDGSTTADLSDHPWAGARVLMTLSARDDGGNEGRSEPAEVTLPQRPFTKPLAKALVEQRRNLVLAPDDRAHVAAALDGLAIAPERFTPEAGIYLGLVTAQARLRSAKTDDDLREVADFLWQMALGIEDGNLSDAERELRAAEQKLREAMQRGASDEEMRKLTDDLRAALDKFMQQLAEQQQRDAKDGKQSAQSDRPSKTITPQDLKSMLDRMAEMARNGDLAEAQQMLDQLQDLLENLKSAERGDGDDQASREMEQQLGDLDRMTRDEQQLRDQTFRDGQKARRKGRQQGGKRGQPNEPGQQGQQGQQGSDESAEDGDGDQPSGESGTGGLQDKQAEIRKRLGELREKMKQFGMKGEQGLDDAESAMGEAEGALGQGQNGKAVDAQGRALDGLRRGAQGLAQQMQGGEGTQAEGNEDGDGPGNPNGNRRSGRDPLNRPSQRSRDAFRAGGMNVGPGAAQRAQQVLEELRRRLADPARPQEELDYLERLLRRY